MPNSIDLKDELTRALQGLRVDPLHVLASFRDHVLVLDRSGRVVAGFGEWPGDQQQNLENVVGRNLSECFGTAAAPLHERAHARLLRGEHVAYEWTVSKGRQPLWLSTVASPLRDATTRIVGVICVTRDISERATDARELKTSAARQTKQLQQLERGIRELADIIETYRMRDLDDMPRANPAADLLRRLSARERQVFDLLAKGYRLRSIAAALHVSPDTVRNHLKAMFKKTGRHSQEELAALVRSGSGNLRD